MGRKSSRVRAPWQVLDITFNDMANTITISVIEHKGTYSVTGDITARGDYALVADFALFSFSGSVEGAGKFSAARTSGSMMYRMEPDRVEYASTLMDAALAIQELIEEKFAPVQEDPSAQEEPSEQE